VPSGSGREEKETLEAMTDDETRPNHRFAREVSAVAPKPGHDLATASFQLGDETYALHVVEGPAADAVGFLGIATNFERSRVLRFALHGSLVERLDDLPRVQYQPTVTHRILPFGDTLPSDAVVERATTVFSSLRAANGVDPEAAIVGYELVGGERVSATITGYQRGWYWDLVVVVVALAIAALRTGRRAGEAIEVTVEQELGGSLFQVSGAVSLRESLSG
jgi:hypothetical protein